MATTYRDMQNPNTADLPFAQEYSNEVAYPIHSQQPTIPINFGFNQSLSLASLNNPPASPRGYTRKGGIVVDKAKRVSPLILPPIDYSKHGCSCPNCLKGKGQCSDKCAKCNAWDLGCEASCGIDKFITQPVVEWGTDTTKTIIDTVEDTKDTIVEWGKDTTKTIIDTVVDTTKIITDPITQPIESLKYIPIILIGGVALLAMGKR